jgi:hypothetical protein
VDHRLAGIKAEIHELRELLEEKSTNGGRMTPHAVEFLLRTLVEIGQSLSDAEIRIKAHVALAPRQILRLPGVDQINFQTSFFQDVVYRDPVHARGLHGDGPNPALLQPIGHLLQFGCGAPEATYRFVHPCRWHSHVVEFVADINSSSIRMHHLQIEIFALDLPRHLSPLLAVHLVPMVRRRVQLAFLVFSSCLGFMPTYPR